MNVPTRSSYLIITSAIVLLLGMGFVSAVRSIDSPIKVAGTERSFPSRLIVSKIGVDAIIEPVGLTPKGAMGSPSSPEAVAWFQLSKQPGETGTAVLAGHYGWKSAQSAVFDSLHTLIIGDKISVQDINGKTVVFTVSKVRSYDLNDIAPEAFSSNDGKAHLTLITCEGVWDANLKKYSGRLVVFADKE